MSDQIPDGIQNLFTLDGLQYLAYHFSWFYRGEQLRCDAMGSENWAIANALAEFFQLRSAAWKGEQREHVLAKLSTLAFKEVARLNARPIIEATQRVERAGP